MASKSVHEHALRRSLELTEFMVAAARNSQWNDVAALEVERGHTLAQALVQAPAAEELPLIQQLVQRMLQMNNELLALGESTRRGLALSLKRLSDNRVATGIYSSNQA